MFVFGFNVVGILIIDSFQFISFLGLHLSAHRGCPSKQLNGARILAVDCRSLGVLSNIK